VNADSIAAGISPFNVESVAFESGRIMLQRIRQLMKEGVDFAFETTLATRSYVGLIHEAKSLGFEINLIFFWLDSPEMARLRVQSRVAKGGHNIPSEVIERRYYRGLNNLVNLYMSVCDSWWVYNNMFSEPLLICSGFKNEIYNYPENDLWKNFFLKTKKNGF
jgi:predicted ABC-type ATPase